MITENDPHWTPEQRLIAAIIMTAYRDMLPDPSERKWRDTEGDAVHLDTDRAIAFLTDRTGPSARLRNHYAALLDIDGDLLAERVRRMLDGELPFPLPSTPEGRKTAATRHDDRVAAARARWLHLKEPTSTSRARSERTPVAVTL